MSKLAYLTLGLSLGSLVGCATYEKTNYTTYTTYQPYAYNSYRYYDGGVDYRYTVGGGQVNVPNSYHVGLDHSPVSHKDVDKNWVNSQNPQSYTIEVAEGEKAAQVAGKLYNVPKNNRTAQVKSYRGDGSVYYKGVYGSYNSYEEAQKAYNSLPANVKQGANIKSWNNIQENAGH